MAMNAAGGFVVVWEEDRNTNDKDIYHRLFDAASIVFESNPWFSIDHQWLLGRHRENLCDFGSETFLLIRTQKSVMFDVGNVIVSALCGLHLFVSGRNCFHQ